jgi:exopolyphosphatase / guanosine-5'-triphosphate,3'-diphosphate pyrophosphatase
VVAARAPLETLGVIDLGTNTFHLLIVEIFEEDESQVKEKFKEVVKLGEGGINAGVIAPAAFERGIAALVRFRRIMDSRGVTKALACGTSALRGASNSKAFVEKASEQAGIDIRIINGNEEALLIYKGVRRGVQIPYDEEVLLVDIGGGSVEFIVADHAQAKLLRSLKLGAARLLETVRPDDPITPAQIEATRQLISLQLDPLIDEIKDFDIPRVIGSSGSFETLAALVAYDNQQGHVADNVNGYRFDYKRFKKVMRKLLSSTRAERLAMSGMDPARVDMILMSVILVDYVLDRVGIEQVMVSSYALKEGILQDYLETGRDRQHDATERSLREQAVRVMLRRYEAEISHADQTAKLCLDLFDSLHERHGYGEEERELLYYSSLLHDIGHFVNRSGHHKHGQYLVLNSGLRGFSTNELLLISNVVRYHRKSPPTREHFHYNLLYKEHKDMVRKLAGILRIGDNLDRGHRHLVQGLRARTEGTRLVIEVEAHQTVDLEIESARLNTGLFEEAFGVEVDLRQVKPRDRDK